MEDKQQPKAPFNGNVQRVHRSIAFQPHALNQYEEDSPVAKKIIYYLQDKFDRDLFGFIRLDPHVFAKETGVDRTELAKLHPSPYQKRIKKLSDQEIEELKAKDEYFATVFENALYRITRQRIEFVINDEINPDSKEKTTKFFDFFDEVKIIVDRKNRNKKVYAVKPSLFFAKTLKQYTLINPQKYFLLSKGKSNQVGDLYVYLNYIKQTLIYKKQAGFSVHKNLLVKILNLPNLKRDRKKNEVITKYLEQINSTVPELGLRYQWIANMNNSAFKDFCYISYSNLEQAKNLIYNPTGVEERTLYYFDHHLNFRLVIAMSTMDPSIDVTDFHFQELFSQWLNSAKDMQLKYKCYTETYKDLWNDEPQAKYSEYYFREARHLSGEFARRKI